MRAASTSAASTTCRPRSAAAVKSVVGVSPLAAAATARTSYSASENAASILCGRGVQLPAAGAAHQVYRAGMDSRTARRTAEKAARNLITDRAALVGELGVATAERTQLASGVDGSGGGARSGAADAVRGAARWCESWSCEGCSWCATGCC